MASRISLLAVLFFFSISMLTAQQYQWLKGIHGNNDEEGLGIAVDNAGHPISCGYFTSYTMNAGGISLEKKSNDSDAYIIKYDLNGSPIWMDNPGGEDGQVARGVGADSENNMYLTGFFKGEFGFGNSSLQAINLADGMLLKYDKDGNEIWGLDMNSTGRVECRRMSIDNDDNIIIGGFFYDYSLGIGDTSIINHGSLDIFVAKFTSEGLLLWARSFGGSDQDFIMGMCVDEQNNIYFTGGSHSQNINFGSYSFYNNCTKRAALIVHLDPDGEVIWAEKHDDGYDQQFMSIDVDSDLNIYTGGYYKGDFFFGSEFITNEAGHFDVFLAKYDAQHQPLWIQQIYSDTYERTDNLVLDEDNNIFLEIVTMGNLHVGDATIINNGARDFVISKFDKDGNYQWNIHGGGEADDRSFGMAMSPLTNLYFTGYFMSAQLALGTHQISNSGNMDAFIASIGPDCLLPDPNFTYVADSFSVQFVAIPGADAYSWDFGDGVTSTAIEPMHTYANLGNYNVCLTVANVCGQDTQCETVQICIDPTAGFIYSIDIPQVSFMQTAQYADDYLWDFGDGNTSIEENPVHTYAAPDSYIVSLTVFNDCGADQYIDTVWMELPMCFFNFTIKDGLVYFTDNSLDPISCFWEFGDGKTSTEYNPVHQYEDYGTYHCCLTIENYEGIFNFCDSVFYCEEVSAEFNFELHDGLLVTQDLSSKADIWHWDFGDGNTSLLAEPTHNYESSGTYNVCLEASNPCSKDSFCKEIYFELAVESSAILIYLVPSRDILKIDVPQEGQYELTLYNTLGEPVYQTSFSRDTKGSFEFNITSLATGVYICDVGSQNISLRKKIFISH